MRNLALFVSGKAVSVIGSSIYTFAISLYVLKLTGSALNYATTLVLSVVPMILISPIAGVIADRFSKKWLVVGMDVLNSILFFSLYVMTMNRSISLPLIYTFTVLISITGTFFALGIESAKPNLVKPEHLVKINALSKFIDSFASILGPIIGGIIFAVVNIRFFILFNAVSFLLSAISEWFIDYEFNRAPISNECIEQGRGESNLISDLRQGWTYFTKNKAIMDLFLIFVALNFMLGFSVNVPGPYILNELLKMTSSQFGLINSMFPLGLIIGTLTVEKVMKRIPNNKLILWSSIVLSLIISTIGLPVILHIAPDKMMIFYGTLYGLIGMAIAYVDIPITTIMQNEIPSNLLGRVMSLVMSFVKIILPVALILSGALIGRISIVIIPVIGSLATFTYCSMRLKTRKSWSV